MSEFNNYSAQNHTNTGSRNQSDAVESDPDQKYNGAKIQERDYQGKEKLLPPGTESSVLQDLDDRPLANEEASHVSR